MDGSSGRDRSHGISFGLVGTYPPTRCGIATFTASLGSALASGGAGEIRVVSCLDEDGPREHPAEVAATLVRGSARSRADAAAVLDESDIVLLQHEFGIYGGDDGDEVLDLVTQLTAPVVAVLHTVLTDPSARRRAILETLAETAERVVVQSGAARDRLLEWYAVDPETVHLVPHGARPNLAPPKQPWDGRPPLVLTWGLLGPGKGIELGIEAISRLGDLDPAPRYLVLGQTHPKVVEAEGERYRESLVALAHDLGVADRVRFENGYGDTGAILTRAREADIVLLPYRSRDQVVSGVLVEAIASGTPVVATRFPHAVEVLSEGSGVVVEHGSASAIERALRAMLSDPARLARHGAVARRQAAGLSWDAVGREYRRLARAVVAPPAGVRT